MFLCRPFFTLGSLHFAVMAMIYITVGVTLEEYGLLGELGREYLEYKKKTDGLIPGCPFGIPIKTAEKYLKMNKKR